VVYSWGSSEHGKLGHGPAPDVNEEGALMTTHTRKWWPFCPTPMEVNGLRGRPIAKVACGEFHSLAATIDGEVLAWGLSSDGLLGIEPSDEHSAMLSTALDGKHMQADLPVAVDNLPWGYVRLAPCSRLWATSRGPGGREVQLPTTPALTHC
jgi:alpha-tubulin suppressor-like RCC1 family protein